MTSDPDREQAVMLIQEAMASGARQSRACEELGLSVRTYQRWVQSGEVKSDGRPAARRPVPSNKLTEEERLEVLSLVNQPHYQSMPPSQIVPDLADKNVYVASESSFYRILRAADQQHHRGRSRAPEARSPRTHCATAPNQVWCWDITWLPGPARGTFYYLYMMMDLFSRKVVGWDIHDHESSELAAMLMEKACLREGIAGRPLILHSDNGSPMKGASMLATLERLGVMTSYSRPRVSNDNAYAESLFRTCKYRPDYPHNGFADLGKAGVWVQTFMQWYNFQHKHSGLKFVTPVERHNGIAEEIMCRRRRVYSKAKAAHPERWSGKTRNWDLPDQVWLNPETEQLELKQVA